MLRTKTLTISKLKHHSHYRCGEKKAGFENKILEGGFNGIADITMAEEVKMMSDR